MLAFRISRDSFRQYPLLPRNKGMTLYAWCLMPNHAHLNYSAQDGFKLPDTLRDMKKFTAAQLLKSIKNHPEESRREWMLEAFHKSGQAKAQNTNFQFWRQDNRPIELYSNKVIDKKVDYIHLNPVEAGFVDTPESYRLSSAVDYAEGKGLLDVVPLFSSVT